MQILDGLLKLNQKLFIRVRPVIGAMYSGQQKRTYFQVHDLNNGMVSITVKGLRAVGNGEVKIPATWTKDVGGLDDVVTYIASQTSLETGFDFRLFSMDGQAAGLEKNLLELGGVNLAPKKDSGEKEAAGEQYDESKGI